MENTTPFEFDVFLSASNKDQSISQIIWSTLVDAGLKVFWAEKNLQFKAGQSWPGMIEDALAQCRHFVLVASDNGLNSRFVLAEHETFFSQCMEPPNRLLIPVLTPGMSVQSLPLLMRRLQSYRFDAKKDGLKPLLEAILMYSNNGLLS